jgi:peptidoglycan hydrolase-like protein with peptidoglycan-binding domain
MSLHRQFLGTALFVVFTAAHGGTALSTIHPEESYPDNLPLLASPGPYAALIKDVQEKLHQQGFDPGPVNGAFGTKTQAALAQFQLSLALPASGALDDETLHALGVQRNAADQTATAQAQERPPTAAAQGGSSASGGTTTDE